MDPESRELLLALASSALRLAEAAIADSRLQPSPRRAVLEARIRKLGQLVALVAAMTRAAP